MTVFGAPPKPARRQAGAGELARRFLHAYGPATHVALAAWAGIAPSHAKALLAGIAERSRRSTSKARRALVLAADA